MGTNEDWEKVMLRHKGNRIQRAKAIKLYCKLQCAAGDTESWKNCLISNCFLWRFRLGKESLAKPKSFQKQRKNSIKIEKNDVSNNDHRGSLSLHGGFNAEYR